MDKKDNQEIIETSMKYVNEKCNQIRDIEQKNNLDNSDKTTNGPD